MSAEAEMPLRRALYVATTVRRAPAHKTVGFQLKEHNRHLCPETQAAVDRFAAMFRRHFTISYDVQGLRDYGVDVLLRIGDDAEARYVGFQLKSNSERGKKLVGLLKAQYADALNMYKSGLVDYYIVLCWEPTDASHARLRDVSQAFHGIEHVHVIEPRFAWSFLYDLTTQDLEAIVRAQISEDDPIVEEARSLFFGLTPPQAALLTSIVVHFTDSDLGTVAHASLGTSEVVREAYALSSTLDLGPDRPFPASIKAPPGLDTRLGDLVQVPDPSDLEVIEEYLVENGQDQLQLDPEGLEAVLALAYEARARWSHSNPELERYLYSLLVSLRPSGSTQVEGEDLAELAIVIGGSDLDEDRQDLLLATLLQYNVDSAEECCTLLHLDPTEVLVLEGAGDEFKVLAEYMMREIASHYADGWEYMSAMESEDW